MASICKAVQLYTEVKIILRFFNILVNPYKKIDL